jgi:hypothetical protein
MGEKLAEKPLTFALQVRIFFVSFPFCELADRLSELHRMEMRNAELVRRLIPVPLELFPLVIGGNEASDDYGMSIGRTALIVVGSKHVQILRHRGTQPMECHNGSTREARIKAGVPFSGSMPWSMGRIGFMRASLN